MNHLCFVVDNSLTMGQKPFNGVSLLDTTKSAIESAISNWGKMGLPGHNQYIHLFVTSQPYLPLSSYQHDENHLVYQLKSIVPAINTDPVNTIQTALSRISHFRSLSEAQTLMGYREAFVFQPALLIFLTDKMTKRKIKALTEAIQQGKIHIRSQYQFITYIVSQPSFSQRNVLTEDNFKQAVQNQKDLTVFIEAFRKINGETKFSMHPQTLTSFVWNRIETYKPFLFFNFELKEMRRKGSDFCPSQRGNAYFKGWQDLKNIPLQLVPTKLWKIPLPFELSTSSAILEFSQENNQIKIQKLSQLLFSLDLTKRFNDTLSNILPENRYKVLQNPFFSMLEQQQIQQRFPIFYQYKGQDYPIGLLSVSPKGTEAVFFFGNFTGLNTILKNIQLQQYNQRQIQSSVYPYLMTLPPFYLKFLKILFDKLRLQINYNALETVTNSNNQNQHSKLENSRAIDKKNIAKLFQTNLELHRTSRAECCAIYSSDYDLKMKMISPNIKNYDQIQIGFGDMLQELLDMRKKLGLQDYITSTQIITNSMTKELEKYSTIKRTGQEGEFNENVAFGGNPYKKKRKLNQGGRGEENRRRDSGSSLDSKQKSVQKKVEEIGIIVQSVEPKKIEQNLTKPSRKIVEVVNEVKILKKDPRLQHHLHKKPATIVPQSSASYVPCQTVKKINSISMSKQLQVDFNPINLSTSAMLRNVQTIQHFFASLRNK